jgi:hypothetical protein
MAPDLSSTLTRLKDAAVAHVARNPQYRGHFASYRLVRVKGEVKTPRGLAFAQGEYAIADDRDPDPGRVRCEKFVTVWSKRNQADTAVRASNVEWL